MFKKILFISLLSILSLVSYSQVKVTLNGIKFNGTEVTDAMGPVAADTTFVEDKVAPLRDSIAERTRYSDTITLVATKYDLDTLSVAVREGDVNLSWGSNTGVLFETNDTINVSDNNYISGDNLYSTGYHYFDASNKFYMSTEPASGNVLYVNNDGTNVLLFGTSNTRLRSPTGNEINLLGDELRMTFDSYNFANATNSENFVTIESAPGAGRVNLLGIKRPGSAFSGFVIDTNLILTSDTSIYADFIKIDSIGFTDGSWQSTAATEGGGEGTLNLSGINNGAILQKLNDTIFGSDTLSYVNYNLNIAEDKNILIRNLTNSVGGTRNVIIGDDAGAAISNGSRNVIIGDSAGLSGATYYSVVIGEKAGGSLTNGNWNTFIGKDAGTSIATGSLNTFVGFSTGSSMPSGNRNVIIGGNAGDDLGSVDDKLIIETQVFGSSNPPLLYGDFAADTLQINGDLKVTGYAEVDSVGFADGSWQTTASTGGSGSSSGSAREIQFSDGSGGFDSDDNFKWSDDTLFFNTQSGNEAYIGWLEGPTDKFYFHLPNAKLFELSGNGFGDTRNSQPFVNYRGDYTEDLTYSWSGTNRNNSGLSLPFANGVLLRGNDAKFYLSGDADTATIQLNGDNVTTWREDTVEINGDLKVTGFTEVDSIKFGDNTWQSTAATGGSGSSSGSAGEIQYSDGSGGFDSDTNFYYENDNVFIKTNLKINDSLYIGDDFYITHAGNEIKYESTFDNLDFIWNTERGGYFKSDGVDVFRYNSGGLFVEKVAYFYENTTLRSGKDLIFNDASNNAMGRIRGGDNLEIIGNDNSNIYFQDTVNFGEKVIVNDTMIVNGYIEADSIILINNTYSDIAFEDDYELMTIKDAVEYAYKNGNLKGMDRDGLTNPISYLNNLELKIEDLYLYTYSQQLEIERLRNLIMVIFIIISFIGVTAFYKHLLN